MCVLLMLIHILTTSIGHVPIVAILAKGGTPMSEDLSAITATRQKKNVVGRCYQCKQKRKVTVHVDAHDRYFWFDPLLDDIWPNMTEADARVLIADKEQNFGYSAGHNSYVCQDCVDLQERLWRKHINEEAENERL